MPKFFNKGFTLIELMVAISVIAILSGVTLSVINVQRIRERALDSVKKEDLQTIATALERYYADNNTYPINNCLPYCIYEYSNSWDPANSVYSALTPKYLKTFPRNPSGTNKYEYWVSNDLQNYCLCYWSTTETNHILNGCPLPHPNFNYYVCVRNPF